MIDNPSVSHDDDTAAKPPAVSAARAFALMTVVFAITFAITATSGHSAYGMNGVAAAGVACAVCWVGSAIALGCIVVLRQPLLVVQAVGLGMLARMGLALGAGIILTSAGGPLAEAGVFGMIVAFYLVGLVIETGLAVRLIGAPWQGMSKV